MMSCWQDNPDNRPTFETLFMRFDEFMIQAEPSYREVIEIQTEEINQLFPFVFRRDFPSTTTYLSEPIRYNHKTKNRYTL
jgi:hypothetical protein